MRVGQPPRAVCYMADEDFQAFQASQVGLEMTEGIADGEDNEDSFKRHQTLRIA